MQSASAGWRLDLNGWPGSSRKQQFGGAFSMIALDRCRLARRKQISGGKNLDKDPLLQQTLGTLGQIDELDSGLSPGIGPGNSACSFDAQPWRRQIKAKLNLLVRSQGSDGLHGDPEFAEIAENGSIRGVEVQRAPGCESSADKGAARLRGTPANSAPWDSTRFDCGSMTKS